MSLKVDCGIFSDKLLQLFNLGILRLVTIYEKMLFKVSVKLCASVSFPKFCILDVWQSFEYAHGGVCASFAKLIHTTL